MSQDDLTLEILPEGHWQVELVQGWSRKEILVRGKRSSYWCWPEDADYLEVKATELDPEGKVHGRYSAKRYAIPVPGNPMLDCRCCEGGLAGNFGEVSAFLGDYFDELSATHRLCILMKSSYAELRSITRIAYVWVESVKPEPRERRAGETSRLEMNYLEWNHLTERNDVRQFPPDLDFIAWRNPCLETSGKCLFYDDELEPDRFERVDKLVEWAHATRKALFNDKR